MKITQILPAAGFVAVVSTERGLISRPLISLALVETDQGQQLDGLLTGRLGRYASLEPGFVGIYNREEARRLAIADNSNRFFEQSRKERGLIPTNHHCN